MSDFENVKTAYPEEVMDEEEEMKWWEAGSLSFESGHVPEGCMPPFEKEPVQYWLWGFEAAHAEANDDAVLDLILLDAGDGGEVFEDALLRVAPQLYVMLDEAPWRDEMELDW